MEKFDWIDCQRIKWNIIHPYFQSWIVRFSEINNANLNVEGGATMFPLQFIYVEWKLHMQEKNRVHIVENIATSILCEQNFRPLEKKLVRFSVGRDQKVE